MFTVRPGQRLTLNKEKMKKLILIIGLFFGFNIISIADVVTKLDANYTIPTNKEEDRQYSTYNLDNYQVTHSNVGGIEEVEVKYEIPELMGGETQVITMRLKYEIKGVKFLDGNKAIAFCTGKWIEMRCDVRFKNIFINLEKVQKILEARGVGAYEISKRISILSKFSGDPIGVSQATLK